MKRSKKTILSNVEITAAGLRDALFDEINALRRGEDTLRRAKAIAQIAHRIIEAARLSLEVSSGFKTEVSLGTNKKDNSMRSLLKNAS